MNRDDFNILNNNIIYFDNGATSLKPKSRRPSGLRKTMS